MSFLFERNNDCRLNKHTHVVDFDGVLFYAQCRKCGFKWRHPKEFVRCGKCGWLYCDDTLFELGGKKRNIRKCIYKHQNNCKNKRYPAPRWST